MAGRSRIPLLVIGGGIGGLAAAIAASKAGQPVHVIEKAEAFAELGAGLQLGPNATRSVPPTISSTAGFYTVTKRQRAALLAASNSGEASRQLTRRRFVTKVVVGIASLPFMKGLSSSQVRGRLGYMKIVDNAAMFMAVEKGFFTAEGLELEPVPLAGDALMVQGITSGDLQIGWSNVISLSQAHVEGFDLKLVAGGATHVKGPNESHALIVKGREVNGPPPNLALVFQEFNKALFAWRSVLGNVPSGLEARGKLSRADKAKAEALIELVGLKGFENHYPWELSACSSVWQLRGHWPTNRKCC